MSRTISILACAVLVSALACSGRSTDAGDTTVNNPDNGAEATLDNGTADNAKTDTVADAPKETTGTDVPKTDTTPTDTTPTDTTPTDVAQPDTAQGDTAGEESPDAAGEEGTIADIAGETTPVVVGTSTVISSNNKLPTAWDVTDATVLKKDGTGTGATAHVNQLVKLDLQTTVISQPCPLPNVSGGKTYCDGFSATDTSGNEVVVDYYSFLGAHPACTIPTSGTLNTITGILEDNYDSTTKVDTWVLALVDCAGVGLGTAYAGTETPDATTDIQDLFKRNPAKGEVVTVKGVVVGTWSTASGYFGFTMQDPGGGDASGITVFKSNTSTTTSTIPNVGDYVSVNGPVKHLGAYALSINL